MPNTALNRTTQVLLTNKSGGSVAYGAVVIVDTTTDSSFTTTTTSGISTAEVGVVLEPNGIANNALGMVAVGGWCPQITLNTAATRGQFIKSHTVAGQGTPHSSPQQEGDFAVALEASANPAVCLFGSPNGPTSGTGTVTNTGTLTSGKAIQGNGSADITVSSLTATVVKAATGTLSAATEGTDYVSPLRVHGGIVNGRLTTETGVPVSTTDRTAQATLYFTPYNGNQIALYTGSVWVVLTFSEISLALSGLTSGKNYDVFCDYNAGTPQLVLSAAWASDTTRTDSLALQDGVYVKSGTTTYRWVGTIRTTGTTTTEDSGGITGTTQVGGKRFVWNTYNQVQRPMKVIDTTDNWAYGTNTVRQANGASGNKVEYVDGSGVNMIRATLISVVQIGGNNTSTAKVGVGVDSTTTFSGLRSQAFTADNIGINTPISSVYEGAPGLGYHYISWNESGAGGTRSTFFGDNGGDGSQCGLTVSLWD
jgi:hypothetical protein